MVSIIVTAYNVEKYIVDCIESIINQSYKDIEIIVIDDGSTDHTLEICMCNYNRKENIKIIHTENQGALNARLSGVNYSTGEWIMFVDGDDILPEYSVEVLYKLNQSKYDIFGGNVVLDRNIIINYSPAEIKSTEEYVKALLTSNTYLGCCAKLIRRSLFKGIDTIDKEIVQNEDLLMMCILAEKASSIFVQNQLPVYYYLNREGSVSKNKIQSSSAWITLFYILQEVIKSFKSEEINSAFAQFVIHRMYHFCVQRGFYIDIKEPIITQLITSVSMFPVDGPTSKMLMCIKKRSSQLLTHIQYLILNNIKKAGRFVIFRILKFGKAQVLGKLY